MKLGLEPTLCLTASGVCILLPELGLTPQIQLPVRFDTLTAVLAGTVCVGLVLIVGLIFAFLRVGRGPQPPPLPEEVRPPAVKTCPQCGHLITRPDERFCIQCGTTLPD
jgi:hypothetical protein